MAFDSKKDRRTDDTRIALLEREQQTIMDKFKEYHEANTVQHEEIKSMVTAMEDKLDEAIKGKADRWVQDTFVWGMRIVGGVVLIAFLSLIIIEVK